MVTREWLFLTCRQCIFVGQHLMLRTCSQKVQPAARPTLSRTPVLTELPPLAHLRPQKLVRFFVVGEPHFLRVPVELALGRSAITPNMPGGGATSFVGQHLMLRTRSQRVQPAARPALSPDDGAN
jgi:hypothetical protein